MPRAENLEDKGLRLVLVEESVLLQHEHVRLLGPELDYRNLGTPRQNLQLLSQMNINIFVSVCL